MGTQRPSRSAFDTTENMSDRMLLSGGKIARDPSPRPGHTMREDDRRREQRRDERYKEPSERDRYYDRDRRPKVPKDAARDRREEKRNVRPLSNIEKENEKEGDRGVKKGDTLPRNARIHGPIMLAAMEDERDDRKQRRREDGDTERFRESDRDRPKDRDVYRRKDERQRDHYRDYEDKKRGVDAKGRRDRCDMRKNDKPRAFERESSAERRRDRDVYRDKAQRRDGRRDTRSEGEVDERDKRRRERVKEKDEVHYQHSRSEGEARAKGEKDRKDRDRYIERSDRSRNRGDRYRDDRESNRTMTDDRRRKRSQDGRRREQRYMDSEDHRRERTFSRERARDPDRSSQSQPPLVSHNKINKEAMQQLEQRPKEENRKENRKMWLEPQRGPLGRDATLVREGREVVERFISEETEEVSVDGELNQIWEKRPESMTVDSEDNTDDFEDNTAESDDRSDEWCDMDRERILSAEDGFITVSSGGEDEEDREDEFKDCIESFGGEQDLNQATSDDSSYEQGRNTPPKYVFCVVGQPDHSPGDDKMAKNWSAAQIKIEPEYDEVRETLPVVTSVDGVKLRSNSQTEFGTIKRDSETERLLTRWRENHNDEEEGLSPIPSNPYADVPVQLPYEKIQSTLRISGPLTPEEEEAIRIRMSGAWSMSEEPKRHSQAPHLKWAKNVVREILGQSDEKIDSPEDTKTERKVEEMPIPVIKADDELETKEEESLEGLRGTDTGQEGMHGDLGTALHGDGDARTHTDTNDATPPAHLDSVGNISDEGKVDSNNEKEVDTYLTVNNTLYKPNSCPSLNYELDDLEEGQGQEEDTCLSEEGEHSPEELTEVGVEAKDSMEERPEKKGVVNLKSSCSFRDLGSEARLRRRGIRKTTTRRKEDPVKEEEEEEEGVGRDRRPRMFSTSDDENERSKSWGELDLRNILDTLGKRKRNSKFFNAAQLYQQYSEAAQNFEILRQARSDVVSVVEVSSSPATSPLPARRPLPPLPQNPHPHSLSHTGSVSSVQSLPLPPPPAHSQRRASSPRLSISLGQSATLWRDLPAVRNSPELQELKEDQRRLQEVRFEVVTSEASYCRSLDIVVEHFVKSKQLGALLTTQDRNWLFSRLGDVRAISHSFLSKLEEKVESDVMAFSVCDVIARHCQRFKMVYVPYLTNQSYQDATYQRLMNENQGFRRIVEKLERSPLCQRLPLRSFLVLPFQRITRIKLLVQNIVKRTTPGTPQAIQAIKSLRLLEKLIQESNDSITQMKSIESLVSLSAKVDFECKTLPLVSQSRILMREGKVTELMDFSLKEQERSLYLHLFNDNLLVSQQKEGGRFTVIDTCPVSELRVENFQIKLHSLQKNVFRLHMSSKALLLRTDTQSDKLRWISALSRPHSEVDFSTAQDFPQMQCIRAFMAQQPDELSLEKADIILVHQQSSDHWVEGTRLSDRHRGWIPESHLDHISIPEIRERNLSDALKLTTATAQV